MPPKKSTRKTCKSPGTIVFIDGKEWCVGEKIISKNPRSRLNKKGKKDNNKTKRAKMMGS